MIRTHVQLSRDATLPLQAENQLMAERLERLEARAQFLDRQSTARLPAQDTIPGAPEPGTHLARPF